jgi:hypothetical protein
MLPAKDVIQIQDEQNRILKEQHQASRIKNMSIRGCIDEGTDALRWLLEDAMHDPNALESIQEGQRLRGLGILCVVASAILLVVYALLD